MACFEIKSSVHHETSYFVQVTATPETYEKLFAIGLFEDFGTLALGEVKTNPKEVFTHQKDNVKFTGRLIDGGFVRIRKDAIGSNVLLYCRVATIEKLLGSGAELLTSTGLRGDNGTELFVDTWRTSK
jgi:hypothetical protein